MKSGIQGIDCMNGDPDNDAQAMAISRTKTPSKDRFDAGIDLAGFQGTGFLR